MSIEMSKVRQVLNEIAPERLQESWDNCGMQIDMGRGFANHVLVCLEINKEVIEEAIDDDIDLIITHHPLLFRPTKCIDNNTVEGKYLIDLIFTGISVYSAHTSFDRVRGGNNDDLAAKLGLAEVSDFPGQDDVCSNGKPGIGRMGTLTEPETLLTFAERLSTALGVPGGIQVSGDPCKMISKVGLCTGSAGEYFRDAAAEGCDLYITGEISHHEMQMAREMGLAVIAAGHFGTEWIFQENMAGQLREKLGEEITVMESKSRANPVDFVI